MLCCPSRSTNRSVHRRGLCHWIGLLALSWSLSIQAGECLLNYPGYRVPSATEGPLVLLLRQEQNEASLRAISKTSMASEEWATAYVPDETKVLAALEKIPALSADDCGAPFFAAALGFPRTLNALLDRKANMRDFRTLEGAFNALSAAAGEGTLPTVQVLVERKTFDVDERTALHYDAGMFLPRIGGGWTPLHFAAARGQNHVIRHLISKGADLHARTYMRLTPLDLARQGSNVRKTEELLIGLGAKY